MLIKSEGTMPASVLASVLVICTLILLSLFFVISLWDSDLLQFLRFCNREQQRANLFSAFVRYSHDSTFMADSTGLLFADDSNSRVNCRKERWGLYEVVEIRAGKWNAFRLFGKAHESSWQAALYVPDNKKALSLSATCLPEGKICLSRNGITYTQVRSEYFDTPPVPSGRVMISEERFPAFDLETVKAMDELFVLSLEKSSCIKSPYKQSFGEAVSFFRAGETVTGLSLQGHIVLCSEQRIHISAGNDFQHIIVMAPSVEIGAGFRGSLQVFSKDTIILGNQVCLEAGSGLWIEGGNPERIIRLGENCEVNGYVIVNGAPHKSSHAGAHYHQSIGAKVRGLVYVDGIAELHGIVNGSLYARELCYFAPEGYYSGLLYQTTLLRHSGIAYPFLMAGAYERRCITWID